MPYTFYAKEGLLGNSPVPVFGKEGRFLTNSLFNRVVNARAIFGITLTDVVRSHQKRMNYWAMLPIDWWKILGYNSNKSEKGDSDDSYGCPCWRLPRRQHGYFGFNKQRKCGEK